MNNELVKNKSDLMVNWQSKLMIVTSIINDFYPDFNSQNVFVRDSAGVITYSDKKTTEEYAWFYPSNKKLYFDWDIYHELQKYLEDDLMPYLIMWFNKEFKTDAKRITAE
jgi:hypothetical protein